MIPEGIERGCVSRLGGLGIGGWMVQWMEVLQVERKGMVKFVYSSLWNFSNGFPNFFSTDFFVF